MPHTQALAHALREARDNLGLSRRQLGERAKVPASFVKIAEEIPEGTLDGARLEAVMRVLGVSEVPEETPPDLELRWACDPPTIDVPPDFSQALAAVRAKTGWTQRGLALEARVSSTLVHRIEHRKIVSVRGENLCRILTALSAGRYSVLGIKAHSLGLQYIKPKKKSVDWDAMPLGEIPDLQIAQQLGCPVATVWRARKRRNIPAWSKKKRSYSRKLAPMKVPENWGDPPRFDNGQIDWDHVPLGEVSDRAIARWVGRCPRTVGLQREKRGIPVCQTPLGIDWSKQPLGDFPDTWIAEALDVSPAAVAQARRTRGIPPAPVSTRRTAASPPKNSHGRS